jgi:hypothetical protein
VLKCNGRISVSFSLRFSGRRAEVRAPKLLHVGRRSCRRARPATTIQGRRVGEWLRKHRSAWAERPRRPGAQGAISLLRRPPRRSWTEKRVLPGTPPLSQSPAARTEGARGANGAPPLAVPDRLAGRTPRSERGDRGSSPCPGACGRVAQEEERFSDKEEAAGSTPASPIACSIRSLRGASSSDGESACLTNKRPLVRLQPRPSCGRSSAGRAPA